MGALLSFLDLPCAGSAEAHRAGLEALSHDQRQARRQLALNRGECGLLFDCEREEGPQDLHGEPLEIP